MNLASEMHTYARMAQTCDIHTHAQRQEQTKHNLGKVLFDTIVRSQVAYVGIARMLNEEKYLSVRNGKSKLVVFLIREFVF